MAPMIQKPFLKWVGGKTQILDRILEQVPKELNNYHEPFLGGGSVLLGILSKQRNNEIQITGKVYAYDSNKALIDVYTCLQSNPDELYVELSRYIDEYESVTGTIVNRKATTIEEAKTSKESYYYWIRNKFNGMVDKGSITYSALFIFLNRTCFRGMHREGPNGFNVPFGNYKTYARMAKTDWDKISILIRDVEFVHSDFRNSLLNADVGDYVYLDPPYAPENSTSFVGYNTDGFNLHTHKELFKEIHDLHARGVLFTMSNAKVDLVTNAFKEFVCKDIVARRAINSKKPGSTTKEVIISNIRPLAVTYNIDT
jgi:DNA adenine methylase